MLTLWPPAEGPATGLTDVTVGAVSKVYRSALVMALVPSGVLTRTWVRPAGWAGETAVILVG